MIKISVIVPIYNVENYLSQCLKSIIDQSLEEIEVLCINDGSTDNSEKIVVEYMEKSSKIRLINQENQGVGIARNTGINLAAGEFVAFMDSDDYYLDENTLSDMYKAAKYHNVSICGGSFSEDHGTWIRKEFLGIYTNYTFAEDKLLEYKDYQFDYGYHRFIYNRQMLVENSIYFPTYIRFQDPPFFVKAMITAEKFYALKRITYCYRYGHQKLEWTQKRIIAVLNGMIDNLEMSNQHNLEKLHRLTLDRLIREYQSAIAVNLNSKNKNVMERILFAESLIRPEHYEENEVPSVSTLFIAAYRTYEEELIEKDKQLKECKHRNIELKNSISYRVGRMVTFLPRKVQSGTRCWKKHGIVYIIKKIIRRMK